LVEFGDPQSDVRNTFDGKIKTFWRENNSFGGKIKTFERENNFLAGK
jgi:hypothetical protein